MKRILVVMGTRPEVVKLAPLVVRVRAAGPRARLTVCSTGQHRQMLDVAMAHFGITPDVDLALMQPGQHVADLLGRAVLALRPLLDEVAPDIVVAQGDTTTVTAAALCAFLTGSRFAHVEAGLRTGDRRQPFPEEVNRRVAGVVADIHFAPTGASAENLRREGVPERDIFVTGNTVVDALRWTRDRAADAPLPDGIDAHGRRIVLVTAHRRESFGEPFRQLCTALRRIADEVDDVQLVYPVHLNPNVQKPVRELLGGHPRITLAEPLDYAPFVRLLARSTLVITDSGGVQEEGPSLGKPVLVMREKTERPEGVSAGVVRLVGTDPDRIVSEASRLLRDESAYRAMTRAVDVYGDGLASQRIAEVLLDGAMSTPAFSPRR